MALSRDEIIRLVELQAAKQGVDPAMARAIAQVESDFDHSLTSKRGAIGVMQLMPRTAAKDLKVDPYDLPQNVEGGVRYVAQLLQRYGGDRAKTLAAYNAGMGVVDQYRGVPPFKETKSYISTILGMLGPASAEAASGLTPDETARLQALKAELARRGQATAPSAGRPAPPTARSTPEQAAAYRAWAAQQSAGGTPPPVAVSPPHPAPGTTEPPVDMVIDIEKASTPATMPAAIQDIEPLDETAASRMLNLRSPMPSTGEITRRIAATGVHGLSTVAGATLGAPLGPLGMAAGAAAGGMYGTRMTNQLGLTKPETPLLETSVMNVYPSDVMNVATSAVMAIPSAMQSMLARSQAGKAIVAADKATQAAQHEWQQAVAEVTKAQQAGRAEAYDKALLAANAKQVQYQQRVQAREAIIATHQQAYQQALQAHQQSTQQAQQSHQQAIAGQERALATARAVPGRYQPQTPSWTLYEKFGDAAKDATVPLAPAKAGLAELRASRGVLPTGEARPFPSAVAKYADALEAGSEEVTVQTIRDQLRGLGPLTRSPNGDIRGAAKQLYGLYADAMEASPGANDLLRNANATFRKEMALQDVSEWLRPGHGVVRIDNQGRQTINVGNLLTKLEKTVADDTLFARSFTPEELAGVRRDFGALAGTPRMPTRPPVAGSPPVAPTVPREVPVPRQELLPGGAGPGRQPPAVPEPPAPVTAREALGERPPWKGRTTTLGAMALLMHQLGVPSSVTTALVGIGAAHVGSQQVRYSIAQGLLSPRLRPLVLAAIDGQGRINPRLHGVLLATMTEAEKKAYERATRPK